MDRGWHRRTKRGREVGMEGKMNRWDRGRGREGGKEGGKADAMEGGEEDKS